MATRMLIDARHPEETRVAVLKGNRIEEFDFESAEHKQIKGNIYLAKVTRVEPSLQAAFVDFGGNRHGFLAFSEIHPDYYQIPAQDRDDLLAEEQAHADEEAALRAAEEEEDGQEPDVEEVDTSEQDDVSTIEDGQDDSEDDDSDEDDESNEDDSDEETSDDEGEESSEDDGEDAASDEDGETDEENPRGRGRGRGRGGRQGNGRGRRQGRGRGQERGQNRRGGGRSRAKEIDEVRAKRQALRRRYKIQDVIQRRQVLLVQVVKEERGNKGAALTSYLSLAGRYCVLMPNSSSGGGISRKISNGSDRKRLKQIVSDLSLPKSMGLIVRTAGLQRTKTEVKRDFDYLARLWDEIREKTLVSSAPNLVHTDSDLIKRAIRDIYNREIEEVVVEGEDGYKAAKQFMKLLMPSHVRRIKNYSDAVPMFQRYGAEDQLTAMYDPVVQLKSGGYLVINPTEALVSIDINSGRSTKEHGIEQTALATNLEAAKEISRQLRLRDMAGLVVIDFIDMEHNSNVRKVERCMKDALKNDRARIQVGRISSFGLMEMSRQRLRTGVLEATSRECPHCDGTGLVRTASSAGLSALRLIEEEAAKGKGTTITLLASTEAAVYLLNTKRADLAEIEARYGVNVAVVPAGEDEGAKMTVQSSGPRPTHAPKFEAIVDDEDDDDDDLPIEEDEAPNEEEELDENGEPRKKRRRRRRGGRGRNRNRNREEGGEGEDSENAPPEGEETEASDQEREPRDNEDADGEEDRPKRRRRRGGRGRRRKTEEGEGQNSEGSNSENDANGEGVESAPEAAASEEAPAEEAPAEEAKKPKPRTRRKKAVAPAAESETAASETAGPEAGEASEDKAEEKPKPRTRRKPAAKAKAEAAAKSDDDSTAAKDDEKPAPKKRAPRRKKAETSDDPAKASDDKPAKKPRKTAAKSVEKAPKAADKAKAKPKAKSTAASKTSAAAKAKAKDEADADKPADAKTVGKSSSDAPSDDSEGARKGGWWQRTFGA